MPDRQKVNVRITAQEKTAVQLQSLPIGPTAEEIEKSKNKKEAQPDVMPSGVSAGPATVVLPSGRGTK